jgi:hypothetical protein
MKIISCPKSNKKTYFAKEQELNQKDVERAFGVLQAWFAIVCWPAGFFEVGTLMKACVILHNMIIEDELDDDGVEDFNYD